MTLLLSTIFPPAVEVCGEVEGRARGLWDNVLAVITECFCLLLIMGMNVNQGVGIRDVVQGVNTKNVRGYHSHLSSFSAYWSLQWVTTVRYTSHLRTARGEPFPPPRRRARTRNTCTVSRPPWRGCDGASPPGSGTHRRASEPGTQPRQLEEGEHLKHRDNGEISWICKTAALEMQGKYFNLSIQKTVKKHGLSAVPFIFNFAWDDLLIAGLHVRFLRIFPAQKKSHEKKTWRKC